ncbi:hypothetical protein PM082_023573 [Marasmius tenuissimus]|nr:hypothetical protein PM082_023573 [Marasmius tenuissimus]
MRSNKTSHKLSTKLPPPLLYAERHQKRAKRGDPPEELYVLVGTIEHRTFIKVGQLKDAKRRYGEHRSRCHAVKWKWVGAWKVKHSHKAEALVHLKMRIDGLSKFQVVCSCGKMHRERFTYPGMDLDEALDLVISIVLDHQEV